MVVVITACSTHLLIVTKSTKWRHFAVVTYRFRRGQKVFLPVVHSVNTVKCIACVNLYKVETIGDAYMVASGLPTVYDRHAQEMSFLALELRESVKHHVIQHLPEQKLQLRIGLHTGSLIFSLTLYAAVLTGCCISRSVSGEAIAGFVA